MSVCLITGGASGLGLECGKAFLKLNQQNKLTVFDLRVSQEVEQDLINEFGNERVLIIKGDVTDKNSISQAFKLHAEKFKGLDLVFNNAGIGLHEEYVHDDLNKLEKFFEAGQKILSINLSAVMKVTMLSIYYMKKLGTPGQIINVSSMGGIFPQGSAPAYSASKHGVIGFSRSLEFVQSETGIRVNTMCPSFIETPLVLNTLSKASGKEVKQGDLIKLGLAMHTDIIVKAFLQMYHDKEQNGQVVTIQLGNKISKKRYPQTIKMPGESERGGALTRIPSKQELKEFKEQIMYLQEQLKKQKQAQRAKL